MRRAAGGLARPISAPKKCAEPTGLAVEHNIHPDNEIWYGAPTFKQAKRVMWNRLKRNIPEDWIQGRPNNTECVMDPAGAGRRTSAHGETDISILRNIGLRVYAMSSHPLVRDRINLVNSRIKTADGKRYFFIDPSCEISIEAMETKASASINVNGARLFNLRPGCPA
jgi:hypothetical protein